MRKRITNVRAYKEEQEKLKQLSYELSARERNSVRTPEILRRALNIPNLKNVLLEDAEFKRRFKRG